LASFEGNAAAATMKRGDDLLATIEAVHAAGLDAQLWPKALAGIAQVVGGVAATLEVIDKHTLRHFEFHSFGLPPPEEIEYLDHYAPLNPRLPFVSRQQAGVLCWDYQIFDEQVMVGASFYEEFLPRMGLRYFVDGMLATSPKEFAAFVVHRSRQQGHVDRMGIAVMERLLPHVQQAFDVAQRLKDAGEARHSLERALDWLADGVALVRADHGVLYANEAFQTIVRRHDGIRVRRGLLDIVSTHARTRFQTAVADVCRLRANEAVSPACADFPIPRADGAPSYLLSVRPLPEAGRVAQASAVAIVFIRDPSARGAAALRTLRDVLGLTEAEASLAQALQAGVPLDAYAREHAVSLNTVYTHLRRIKEKTGCHRMAALIRRLNDLQVPLRLG
jgi:DNA-binding CsgD family transcriptional regulator/PAS domain-containing protein